MVAAGRAAVLLALVVALALVVVAARARREGRAARAGARASPAVAEAPASVVAGAGAHLGELPDLLRRARANPGLLVTAFAAWAPDPQARAARQVVVGAMAALPQPGARLTTLLAAVDASPLAPASDPLQPEIVAAVSALWQGDLLRKGRDLMFAGSRPKAREVVIDSFIALALSDRSAALDDGQRGGLTSDFIDLYAGAAPPQRPQILAAVRMLGGHDIAELLSGHGLRGEAQLESQARYRRELDRTRKAAGLP
ncbi:MAG TPA: hypothetical protein VFH68_04050 [Polyangia bacterium]|nr:hypothetical protein [Polyangia bacterium]